MLGGYRIVRRCDSETVRDEIIDILEREGVAWRCTAACINLSLPLAPEPKLVYRISVPSADFDRADHAIHRGRLEIRAKRLGQHNKNAI